MCCLKREVMQLCLQVTICVLSNIYFKEHVPEEGHNMWPKHVAG